MYNLIFILLIIIPIISNKIYDYVGVDIFYILVHFIQNRVAFMTL